MIYQFLIVFFNYSQLLSKEPGDNFLSASTVARYLESFIIHSETTYNHYDDVHVL